MMDLRIFLGALRLALWRTAMTRCAQPAAAPALRPARTVPGPALSCRWRRDPATGPLVARWSADRPAAQAPSRPRIARVLLPARRGRATRPCHRAAA